MQKPVTTITAGAGYGKTQAVYSFLQNYKALTAWMQLSERDNNQERFWENFTAAVGVISKESARRLAETGFPSTERGFDRYLTIPREDVIPLARYVFVYDDFHLVRNKAVLRFLKHSITVPFPNIRSIIISRTEPDIDTAALDARHIRTVITEEALRFTEEETAKYFRLQGLKVSYQTCHHICRDTEGWAFAIHLSALFLKRLPVPDPQKEGHRLPGMRSNVFRLLETEVMEPVSPGLRKFLITLSLIDLLPRDLLIRLNPEGDLIAEMERIGSFVRYDPLLKNYSIHQLFLEYLVSMQEELEDQEKQKVYQIAAEWCEKNDRKIDAIAYYEKAGDYRRILSIFNKLPQILPSQIAYFLKEVLNRIPESQFRENPLLNILFARVYISLGLFKEGTECLWKIIEKMETDSSPVKYCVLLSCYLNLGITGLVTCTYTGDYSFVEYFKKACVYSPLSNLNPVPPVSVANTGSYICRVLDTDEEKIARYLRALEESAAYVAQAFGGCMYGMDKLARGEYAFFRGNLPEAESFIREAIRMARERDQYEVESRSLFYLLRMAVYRGNHAEITEILKKLADLGKQEHYPNHRVHYDITMGWFHTQIGEPGKLAQWLRNNFEDSDINSRGQGLEILVKAKYHLCEKKYPAALASLENRKDVEGNLLFGRIETLALEAVCRYNARDRDGALDVLRRAYLLAEKSSITMPFTELGRYMRSLTDWAIKEGPPDIKREWLLDQRRNAAGYAKKLFSVTMVFHEHRRAGDRIHSPATRTPVVLLSRREQEVLSCLSRGLTRTEIAGTLSLSINTIKSIIRSIYNKLGAVNRSNAVQTAVTAGILERSG
jgi:LuxR family maltose regulon positive regulatory protein